MHFLPHSPVFRFRDLKVNIKIFQLFRRSSKPLFNDPIEFIPLLRDDSRQPILLPGKRLGKAVYPKSLLFTNLQDTCPCICVYTTSVMQCPVDTTDRNST